VQGLERLVTHARVIAAAATHPSRIQPIGDLKCEFALTLELTPTNCLCVAWNSANQSVEIGTVPRI
jgi:hypothetical protein